MIKISYISYSQKAILFLILVAFILLFGNNLVSLWDQDEAAYAGFAKNMVESGNWLMPDFMWSEVHRKPPLHFWNIAISYKLFGVNEFAVRFPSVVFVWLTIALIFFSGKKIFGERESFIGMMVLSTSFLVMSLAKVSVTDATLLFFTTLCAISMLQVLLFRSKFWIALFWIGFSLALLTKGPPIILFTSVFGFILIILHPDRKNILLLHPWFFLPVAILPLWYWGYLCMQTEEGKVFINWMIDWYILKRVGGSVFGQTGPPGTHLLGLLVFFLPYFLFFPKAIFRGIKGLFNGEKKTDFLLAAWFVAGWFIYELTPSKLPAYVIAAHVPLALIIARLLITESPNKTMLIIHIFLNSIIYLVLIAAPIFMGFSENIKWIFASVGVLFIVLSILLFTYQKSKDFYKFLLLKNILFQIILWCVLLPNIDELKNGSLRVAKYIEQTADKNSHIIIANNYSHPPSLPFYLKQRFDNVYEEYNIIELEQLYNKRRSVLILTREQKDILQNNNPNLTYTQIRPFFTDRIQQDGYFIVSNLQTEGFDIEE
jgi:4-amino-4-deoxy-L-arabinose transferase-like glycosyltransferase